MAARQGRAGVGDVAYLLATGLQPQVRWAHEAALLERYAQAPAENGVQDQGIDRLHRGYGAHLPYAFEAMVVTLAVGGMMALEDNPELFRRMTAAVVDQDAYAGTGLFSLCCQGLRAAERNNHPSSLAYWLGFGVAARLT